MGVHNGENPFATHMYNFWSGFGGNISILALIGALIAIYRRHTKYLKNLVHPMNIVKAPLNLVHKKEDEEREKNNTHT